MKILVIAIGRAKPGPERALFEHYVRRISPKPVLKEMEEKRALPPAELKKREGDLLLAAVPAGALRVALDGRGKALSSTAFAEKLGGWRDDGVRELAFLIGGPDGLDPRVTKAADFVLSLGAMTWPHLLVRGMLAEQIFRAQCILAGHPYHRE